MDAGSETPSSPASDPTAGHSQQTELPLGDSTPGQVEAASGTTDPTPGAADPYHDEYHDYHAHSHGGDHYQDEYHHGTSGGEYHSSESSADPAHGGPSESAEDPPPTDDSGEPFGGPIKPFLEHLEDLRWVLIKTVSAVLIGMVVALVASNYIIQILTWPLKLAQDLHETGGAASDIIHRVFNVGSPLDWRKMPNRPVPVRFGTNEVLSVKAQDVWNSFGGTNKVKVDALEFTPITLTESNGSTVRYLALKPVETPERSSRNLVLLKNYGPLNAFIVALKIALYGGLVLSMPFVIYYIAQFILPALRVREKKFLYQIAGYGSGLFLLGVVFCYFVVMTVTILASVGFSNWMGFGADEWRADEYISFTCKFMIGMGLAFELPLVLLSLVKIGILNYQRLSAWRMYALIANLILAAIVTPSPDPFTMCVVAIPMQLLYEISVFIAWRWHVRDEKRKASQPAGD